MKDSEFIELLNLYLDHEISTDDAARLEAEVQNNPARRRVYREYCQMQKACKVLAEDFQSEAAVIAERAVAPNVIDFASAARAQRPRLSGFYTVGAFAAAAACLAIIFVGRSREQHRNEAAQPVVAQQTVTTPAPVASLASTHLLAPTGVQLVSLPTMRRDNAGGSSTLAPLSLSNHAQSDALMAAAIKQANDQFAWISDTQLAPLQPITADQLRLEARPMIIKQEPRTYGSRQPVQGVNTEWAVFQFQK
jgi:anti-sigma factor RsiW